VVDETSCDVQPHGSAIFGAPHSVEGDVQATVRANRFGHLACPTSRLTQFDGAVRHEQGVSP
jgi:hypothetical protein